MKNSFGLVLSGGGARAVAHIGVLKALEEMRLKPAMLSGVSAGALVGVLYAAGHSPEDILAFVKEEGNFSLARFFRYPGGLFSSDNLRRILKNLVPSDNFASLSIPLVVTATDLLNGSVLHVSDGQLHEVVIGSCAIPSVFRPVPYKDCLLVDGGVLDNLPVTSLQGSVDYIIGSHVNNIYEEQPIKEPSRLAVLERCFHLAIAAGVRRQAKLCNVFIEPSMAGYSMFDLRPMDALYQLGYNATIDCMEQINALYLTRS